MEKDSPNEQTSSPHDQQLRPRDWDEFAIPTLLSSFNKEWEAALYQITYLKDKLDEIQRKYTTTLYENDASKRVIARLMREKAEIQTTLETTLSQLAAPSTSHTEPSLVLPGFEQGFVSKLDSVLDETILSALEVKQKELTTARKQRKVPKTWPKAEDIQQYEENVIFSPPSTSNSACTTLSFNQDQSILGAGDRSGKISIITRDSNTVACTLSFHTMPVTSIQFSQTGGHFFTSSLDQTISLWTPSASGYTSSIFPRAHKSGISSIDLHPTDNLVLSSSLDSHWCIFSVGESISLQTTRKCDAPITQIKAHPDGFLAATITVDGKFQVWDLRTNVEAFSEELNGSNGRLAFSENGHDILTAVDEGTKLWDLRKVGKANAEKFIEGPSFGRVRDAALDWSGKFAAVCGPSGVNILTAAKMQPFKSFNQQATSVQFANDLRSILVGTKSGTIVEYSASQ
ncbi:putative Pre-mRNA-processing factor 19 [Blattamonas nauphoetae]|uniref:Pre-mRNA-processing factor 19 n=1 Tax=Blattamonas nauphoetae TaxID=2049346 RepID=A0ABQ9YCF4_9EUKA|nr:putative Pre-mRNA-processing factor 19 [Blattamonas nauphoetae]